jgi:hypothetical protein
MKTEILKHTMEDKDKKPVNLEDFMRIPCHLCGTQLCDIWITYGRSIFGAILPACVFCIPPWTNGRENWWCEVLKYAQPHRRPTPEHLALMLKKRSEPKPEPIQLDDVLRQKIESGRYREKFHVDELLSLWSEEDQEYKFTEERSVWDDETQMHYYPSDRAKKM